MNLNLSSVNLKLGLPTIENEMMDDVKGIYWPNNHKQYELIEQIGVGATSKVYKAKETINDKICAIKIVDLTEKDSEENVLNEIKTLSVLQHENIMDIYSSFTQPDKLNVWMILPYFRRGSLRTILNDYHPNGLPEKMVISITFQILNALEYIHNNHNMLHRDIKCANLFLKDDGTILLGDFGICACLIKNGEPVTSRRTFAGSLWWMAPEVVQQSRYKMPADIWSLGITAIELAKGKPPYHEFQYKPMKVVMEIMSKPAPILDSKEDKKQFTRYFRSFIEKCLIKDPYFRYTAKQILKERPFKYLKLDKVKKFIVDNM